MVDQNCYLNFIKNFETKNFQQLFYDFFKFMALTIYERIIPIAIDNCLKIKNFHVPLNSKRDFIFVDDLTQAIL